MKSRDFIRHYQENEVLLSATAKMQRMIVEHLAAKLPTPKRLPAMVQGDGYVIYFPVAGEKILMSEEN